MGKVVFVELLDKRGHVRQRHRLDAFPATIGRAYSSNVIIDDRLACPEHLRVSLDEEGAIVLEDLKSVNGICLASSPKRIPGHRIPPGKDAEIRIGETLLRFRGEDYQVGPAEMSGATDGLVQRVFEKRWRAFLIFLSCFALFVLQFHLTSHDHDPVKSLIGKSAIFLIFLLIWAGFWSFLNRLTAHAFNFVSHLALGASAAAALFLFDIADEYYDFLFSAARSSEVIGYLGLAVIFSLLVYGHRSMMHGSSPRRRMITSALAGFCTIGVIVLLGYMVKSEFTDRLDYTAAIKPLGQQWIRTETPDEFLDDLGSLKKDVDALAEKEKPKRKKPR